MKGKSTVGLSSDFPRSKRARENRETISIQAEVNKVYDVLKNRTIMPSKWVCDSYLAANGLTHDFEWMARSAGMEEFDGLHCVT